MDILPIGIDASMQAFNNVRIPIITIEGEACMVVLDIGKALEYQDPRAVLVHLDELDPDEIIELTGDRLRAVKARLIDSMSRGDSENYRRINRLTLVTRSGAEALAMTAKTGRAKEFRRWIRKIVLPAYRKQATEQAVAQPRRPPRVHPSKAPTFAEQREARLKLKEQNSEWKVIALHQKAMTAAEREQRMRQRDERDAEDKAAKLALSAKRLEIEARRVGNEAKRIEVEVKRAETEAKHIDIEVARVQAETGRMDADVRMAEIEAAKLMNAMCDQLAASPGIVPEAVAEMRISAFEKLAGRSFPGILPAAPPEVVWNSDSDLALHFDTSARDVGVIIEELGIKDNPDMFRISLVKAPHSNKTIEMSEYSPAAVELMEAALREWMAASPSK